MWLFAEFTLGIGLILLGFKFLRDSRDPTIPGRLRPPMVQALGAWLLGAVILLLGLVGLG